ncbi:hypothetical protein BV898_03569 [Hypsibius exemplaris]|uniref:Uncharacterized protein n=1 Tax=Hypsibius exemplaris TaxID=2072580 RepID=A0A1W0X526_HYPEX|nr:hypothetical protein BV898_03569 [Hypsibius exemplaris]
MRTGQLSSRKQTFTRGTNPEGFWISSAQSDEPGRQKSEEKFLLPFTTRRPVPGLRPKRFSTSHPPETCLGIFSGELIGIYFCKGNLNDQSGAEFGASLTL